MTATVTSGARLGLSPLAAPIACGCCLVAGAAYVVANDPSTSSVYLPCPFRSLTGWWCPGCGMTRATHHLLRGDIVQALRFNLFAIAILAGLAAVWLAWFLVAAGRSVDRLRRIPNWAYAGTVATLVAFAVVRNLPMVPGLRG